MAFGVAYQLMEAVRLSPSGWLESSERVARNKSCIGGPGHRYLLPGFVFAADFDLLYNIEWLYSIMTHRKYQ